MECSSVTTTTDSVSWARISSELSNMLYLRKISTHMRYRDRTIRPRTIRPPKVGLGFFNFFSLADCPWANSPVSMKYYLVRPLQWCRSCGTLRPSRQLRAIATLPARERGRSQWRRRGDWWRRRTNGSVALAGASAAVCRCRYIRRQRAGTVAGCHETWIAPIFYPEGIPKRIKCLLLLLYQKNNLRKLNVSRWLKLEKKFSAIKSRP